MIALASCAFSPLAHRIKPGEEPFVIFVGEGRDQHTDLFAMPANGGPVTQLTFTSLVERGPRVTPSGDAVAFIRMRDTLPAEHRDVVVINLLSYGEATITLPDSAGQLLAVAWAPDARSLFVRTSKGIWQAAAPPAIPAAAPAVNVAAADTALVLWLGAPPFARVVQCAGAGLCIVGLKGDTTALAPAGRDALPWGADSVAWFQDGTIAIRSLGPGHERRATLTDGPANPREATYSPGLPAPRP